MFATGIQRERRAIEAEQLSRDESATASEIGTSADVVANILRDRHRPDHQARSSLSDDRAGGACLRI